MALRWSAVAFVETEKNYRRITGYAGCWAHLDRDDGIAEMQKADNLCSPLPLTFYYRWDTLEPQLRYAVNHPLLWPTP